jgi:hypothetical protein
MKVIKPSQRGKWVPRYLGGGILALSGWLGRNGILQGPRESFDHNRGRQVQTQAEYAKQTNVSVTCTCKARRVWKTNDIEGSASWEGDVTEKKTVGKMASCLRRPSTTRQGGSSK